MEGVHDEGGFILIPEIVLALDPSPQSRRLRTDAVASDNAVIADARSDAGGDDCKAYADTEASAADTTTSITNNRKRQLSSATKSRTTAEVWYEALAAPLVHLDSCCLHRFHLKCTLHSGQGRNPTCIVRRAVRPHSLMRLTGGRSDDGRAASDADCRRRGGLHQTSKGFVGQEGECGGVCSVCRRLVEEAASVHVHCSCDLHCRCAFRLR